MRLILDDDQLSGAQSVRVAVRPPRQARLLPANDITRLLDIIDLNCQLWGGAASPIILLDSGQTIAEPYASKVVGAAIDRVDGVSLRDFDLADPLSAPMPQAHFRDVLAVTFLDPAKKETYRPVTVVALEDDDPWRAIYAACLGTLPTTPDSDLLRESNLIPELTFEHFIDVTRIGVRGSAQDLLARLNDQSQLHPRSLSMTELAYGHSPSTGIRSQSSDLPNPQFAAHDAGPNIVVVCSPGNAADAALLWNLRAANGDQYATPIGVLVQDFSADYLADLLSAQALALQGIPAHVAYVTSTSVSAGAINEVLGDHETAGRTFSYASPSALFRFGPAPSRTRGEVAVWTNGSSSIVPTSAEDQSKLLASRWNHRDLELFFDIDVVGSPLPRADDVRVDSLGERVYAGTMTKGVGRNFTESIDVAWPTKLLMLKLVAQARQLSISSSEPGIACLALLESLDDPTEVLWICHQPLLELLQLMANRQGTAWAKSHHRRDPSEAPDLENHPALDSSDLPEVQFGKFHKALGSQKAAALWLTWAEKRRIIVKGFPIECEQCHAKQWIPIAGFASPLTCQGCARRIEHPFPAERVEFKYRLGESLRRVYEHDAIGHLLTLRYFASLFASGKSSSLVGAHPGLNTDLDGGGSRVGEADVLLLLTDGSAVPIEVKRSYSGVLPEEVAKLQRLADAWKSPWSALSVGDYAHNAPEEFRKLEQRGPYDAHHRVLLTYDKLLNVHPSRSLGEDAFRWESMTPEEIANREQAFQNLVISGLDGSRKSWLEADLLYKPQKEESNDVT